MKTTNLLTATAVVTLVAASIGYSAGTASVAVAVSSPSASPAVAELPIYGLTLPDLSGKQQALKQWQGKVLVVNYWATWCPPCREEVPGFARLQTKFGANGVQFIGISIDTADKVAEFQTTTPVNYPLLIGETSAIQSSETLGNSRQALPFTAVLDQKGRVAQVKLGRFSEAELEHTLETLVSK